MTLYETAQAARAYKQAARSPATKRAYGSDFRLFEAWCARAGLEALPATISTIGLYMTELAAGGVRVATISRRVGVQSSELWRTLDAYPETAGTEAEQTTIRLR
jgi:hypothetical protein